MNRRGMLCSDGEPEARVFVALSLPDLGRRPVDERERVILTPHSRLRRAPWPTQGAGPRRPEQVRLPEPPPPIELPDGRSALQTQRLIVHDRIWFAEVWRRGMERS